MYPFDPSIENHLRHQRLLDEAARSRLASGAARQPAPPWPERVAAARRAIGYRLVEAGLHLALDPIPPRPPPKGSY